MDCLWAVAEGPSGEFLGQGMGGWPTPDGAGCNTRHGTAGAWTGSARTGHSSRDRAQKNPSDLCWRSRGSLRRAQGNSKDVPREEGAGAQACRPGPPWWQGAAAGRLCRGPGAHARRKGGTGTHGRSAMADVPARGGRNAGTGTCGAGWGPQGNPKARRQLGGLQVPGNLQVLTIQTGAIGPARQDDNEGPVGPLLLHSPSQAAQGQARTE